MTELLVQPVDESDRAQTLETGQSFLVQAPAGSGKTELLTRRLLKLLAEVDEPEQILAITFTLAATAEMRQRVLNNLHTAQDTAESSDEPAGNQAGSPCFEERRAARMEPSATARAAEYPDHRCCLPGHRP